MGHTDKLNGARIGALVALAYLAIVLALWLPFNLRGGLPYETGFVYTSEISTWWNGFLNGADHLRIYTSIFYQVAYLMGQLSGFAGSWVPFQITYAALWWARGFLVFLIGRRIVPGQDVFWYLAGALVLTHSSDFATGWAGLLNQSGYTLWMPLAFYLLVVALEQSERWRADSALLAAIFFEHLSLWSFESQLVILLVAPLLLFWRYPHPWRSRKAIAAAWYILPVIYVFATYRKYANSGGKTYQQTILRKVWGVTPVLSDWAFNVAASLKFWTWRGSDTAHATLPQLAVPTVLAIVVFVLGLLCLMRADSRWTPGWRTLGLTLLIGSILLVLSFPAYLILESAASLWRTQILSSFGAGLVLAAAIGFLASVASRKWVRASILTALGALVAGYGAFSAVKKCAFHEWVWERQHAAMAQVLEIAPRLKDGTRVVLIDVPRGDDPFLNENEWFNMALRLAYPGTKVSGHYSYDGTARTGSDRLLLDYQRDGRISLVDGRQQIENGPPSPLAIRRYGK
ncbi:MAG TPA: hypothetical protein VKT81_07145 [Bryobacteraceae bacterium]|nr:hypothetical protein [Bryobacteraceae bacterium]